VRRLFNKLNPMDYHLALVALTQSTGEPEIIEVTLDNFSYAGVHWLQNKSWVWRQKKVLLWMNSACRDGLDSY